MQQYRTTKRQTDYLNKLGICKRGLAYDSKSSRWYDMADLLDILPKHIRRGDKIYNLTMKHLYDGSSDGCVAGYERDDTPRKYAYISDGISMLTALYGLVVILVGRGLIKVEKKEN